MRRVDSLLFLCYSLIREHHSMDRDKLKLIVRNLELLVDSLKAEIYSDVESHKPKFDDIQPQHLDYDEIFEDDDY